jgi:hypothetical protein
MPPWEYEHSEITYNLGQLPIIWDLISHEFENNTKCVLGPSRIPLPTGYYSLDLLDITAPANISNMENVPASDFYSGSMENTYTVYNPGSNTSTLCETIGDSSLDDSGDTNMAM